MRHLLLRLEAPLMSFGGEAVDNVRPTRWFPQLSTLTGLLGNALGLRRVDGAEHQRLQDRLVFGARIDREPANGRPLRDFQIASIGAKDRSWTTRGQPEGRRSASGTLRAGSHLRFRDYLADACVSVVLRLDPAHEQPTLDGIAEALRRPSRPLFIGSKHCLPTRRLFDGVAEADTVLEALLSIPLDDSVEAPDRVRLLWPAEEGLLDSSRKYVLGDIRNWESGLHGGGRAVCEASVPQSEFPSLDNDGEEA